MKKFTFLIAALFFRILLFSQDILPNAGFETWVNHGSYFDPQGWRSLNYLTSALPVYTVLQDSTPGEMFGGKYSAKLITQLAVTDVAPGILTTGFIHSNGVIDRGIQIASRPMSLTGWYKYKPVTGDTAGFEIHLNKAGVEIGSGNITVTDSSTHWTYFSMPVHYTTSDVPDTSLIVFFSSYGNNMQVGSILLLDSLSYSFTSGVNDVLTAKINMFPNPSDNSVTLDYSAIANKETSVKIFDITGKTVLEKILPADGETYRFETSGWNNGLYFVHLNEGDRLSTIKLLVAH